MKGKPAILGGLVPLLSMAAALLVLSVPPARADDELLSPQRLSLLLLKAISYDTKLKERAGASVNIGVIARKGDSADTACPEISAALSEQAKTTTVAGLPVRILDFVYSDEAALEARFRELRPAAVLLCPGAAASIGEISAVTRKLSVVSVATGRETVEKGAALGLTSKGSKPVILVNVTAARSEGAEFGVELLRLAEVVK